MKRGNILFQSKCHSSFFPIESLARQETYNNRFVQVTPILEKSFKAYVVPRELILYKQITK